MTDKISSTTAGKAREVEAQPTETTGASDQGVAAEVFGPPEAPALLAVPLHRDDALKRFDESALDSLLSDIVEAGGKVRSDDEKTGEITPLTFETSDNAIHLPRASEEDLERIMTERLASKLAPHTGADDEDGDESVDPEIASIVVQSEPRRRAPRYAVAALGALLIAGAGTAGALAYRSADAQAGNGAAPQVLALATPGEPSDALDDFEAVTISTSEAESDLLIEDAVVRSAPHSTESIDAVETMIEPPDADAAPLSVSESEQLVMEETAALSPHLDGPREAEPVRRTLSDERIAALLERGETLLKQGDIASARLFFQRIASAGDPRGARGVARTYDPVVLADLSVKGIGADRSLAEIWYAKADEMPARGLGVASAD